MCKYIQHKQAERCTSAGLLPLSLSLFSIKCMQTNTQPCEPHTHTNVNIKPILDSNTRATRSTFRWPSSLKCNILVRHGASPLCTAVFIKAPSSPANYQYFCLLHLPFQPTSSSRGLSPAKLAALASSPFLHSRCFS